MKILLLIFTAFFFLGCEDPLDKGDIFCKIYPRDGYADCAKIDKKDPIKVTEPVEVDMEDLTGYICIPEEQFAKYRRAYEKEQSQIIAEIQQRLNEKRVLHESKSTD